MSGRRDSWAKHEKKLDRLRELFKLVIYRKNEINRIDKA